MSELTDQVETFVQLNWPGYAVDLSERPGVFTVMLTPLGSQQPAASELDHGTAGESTESWWGAIQDLGRRMPPLHPLPTESPF